MTEFFKFNNLFLVIGFVFIFYFWAVTTGNFRFNFDRPNPGAFYNRLVDSFLAGHLDFAEKPSEQLLAQSNPYGGSRYELHDASLYKGKYYLYHGAVPVLLTYLPYKVLTKNYISEDFVAFFFNFGGFLWAALLLLYLRKKYFQDVPEWMVLLTILVLGFGNLTLNSYRRPYHYEISVFAGLFFTTGALYWFNRVLSDHNPPLWMHIIGSLFIGLAVGCRPSLVLSSIVIPIIIFKTWAVHKELSFTSKLSKSLALILPFTLIFLILLLYNYFRFEDPFQFGLQYQLTGRDMRNSKYFDLRVIIPMLYIYLINLPQLKPTFPFIRLPNSHPECFVPTLRQSPDYFYDETVGLFTGIPYTLLLLLSPIIYFFVVYKFFPARESLLGNLNTKFPIYNFLIILIPALLIFTFLCGLPSPTVRFEIDFATLFILVSAIIWFYFDLMLFRNLRTRFYLRIIGTLLAILTIWFGMAFMIRGDEDGIRFTKEYKFVENSFGFISDGLDDFYPSWDTLRARLTPIQCNISTSSTLNFDLSGENLIDGNKNTDWAPAECVPSWIIMKPPHPIRLKSIWFLSRETALFETWKKVDVILYLDKALVGRYSFNFPKTSKARIQHAKLNKPILTNKIKLFVSDPVTENRRGEYFHPIGARLHPGYSEIKLDWE